MAKVIAIIGGGFGDCGKGLMTDYWSHKYQDDAVVIRSNGGAQAAHTVVTPEGQRHVFSHFGSGTFNIVPTFLSKHFVVNPMLFAKEHKAFVKEFGLHPNVYIDPRCLITTPYDMLINQRFEATRGIDKHGSCGVGFGETLERQKQGFELLVEDISLAPYSTKDWLMDKLLIVLEEIREVYIEQRVNMDMVSGTFKQLLKNPELVADFIADTAYMLENTQRAKPEYFKDGVLIFEGAQGLLLDQDYGYFPHVTRSNTGMKNISQILSEIPGEHDVTVNYVTRHYTSRHGAGPLSNMMHPNTFHDKTNVHNDYQGTIQYATLDYDLFKSVTDKDFALYAPVGARKITTMTWMDMLYKEGNGIIVDGLLRNYKLKDFKELMEQEFDILSYGETRKDVGYTDKWFDEV